MYRGNLKIFVEIVFVRLLTIFIQLFFIKCVTNTISVDELGIYYFLQTVSYSLNAVLFVPLDYFQQSNLYLYINEGISIKSYFIFNKRIAYIIFVVLLVGTMVVGVLNASYCLGFVIIILLSVSTYMSLFLRGIVNNLEYRRRAAYNLLIESVIRIGLLYLFLSLFTASSIIVLLALFFASLIAILFLLSFIRKLPQYINGEIRSIKIKNVWHFSYPISIGAIVNWIQLQGYRLVLVPLGFTEVVGYYATVANIGSSGMNVCSTIYNQLFLPDLYKSLGQYLKKYLYNALGIIGVVLLISVFLKNLIVNILTTSIYVEYSYLIFYGIVIEAGNFIVGALTTFLGIHNMTKYSIKVSLFALITFILVFTLVFSFGKITPANIGIPIAISQIVVTLYLGIIVRKIYLNRNYER